MIPEYNTNKIYLSSKLKTDYPNECLNLESIFTSYKLSYEFLYDTKDIWARDYMPIQVSENKFIEYRYDPDYLQGSSDDKETRELKTYPDIVCDMIGLKTLKTDIILDGGNVVNSSNAVILTDKIVWENKRNYTKKQLTNKLHELFEIDKVILIPWDKKCEFGHADGMLRFINEDTVLISGFYEQADYKLKNEIINSLKKAKLNWEWLKCSDKETEDNVAYINFLQTKDLLLMPKLNKCEDNIVLDQILNLYPDYAKNNRIKQTDVTEIAKKSGALNCITWTIKDN